MFDGCSSVRLVERKFENVEGKWDVKRWGGGPKIEKISLTTPTLRFVNKLGIERITIKDSSLN